MTHTPDIRPQDLAMVQAILQQHLPNERKVWVFGSRAKPNARRGADLDLAVDLGRTMTSHEAFLLSDAFMESDLPYKVDIVDWNHLNEPFKSMIDHDRNPLPLNIEN